MASQDSSSNSADIAESKVVALFHAHLAAVKKEDFAEADRIGHDLLHQAFEDLVERTGADGPPRDLVLKVQAWECEQLGDWVGEIAD